VVGKGKREAQRGSRATHRHEAVETQHGCPVASCDPCIERSICVTGLSQH
jgi:hypothetical protein